VADFLDALQSGSRQEQQRHRQNEYYGRESLGVSFM